MATVNVTTPVDTGSDVQVIANDGTTETGITTVNGVVYLVTRAVRRFGDWHGSPLFDGVTVTVAEVAPQYDPADPFPFDPALIATPVP